MGWMVGCDGIVDEMMNGMGWGWAADDEAAFSSVLPNLHERRLIPFPCAPTSLPLWTRGAHARDAVTSLAR